MGRLDGKVAIVTGAASGIGQATARRLTEEGAAVVVADINGDGARAAVEELERAGAKALAYEVDVSEEEGVRGMVRAAVEAFGGLDVLHNNAADLSEGTIGRDLAIVEMDVAVWDQTMAVNLRGPMLGCKHAIPAMLERGGGSIVNTSSGAALAAEPIRAAYAASKGGIVSLTRSVATMYGKQGIRCNAIAPGLVQTPAIRANMTPEQVALFERHHLAPRLELPEDIANMVVYLASDEAVWITGQTIPVDGGISAHNPAYADYLDALG